jgi:hypothetical protein
LKERGVRTWSDILSTVTVILEIKILETHSFIPFCDGTIRAGAGGEVLERRILLPTSTRRAK